MTRFDDGGLSDSSPQRQPRRNQGRAVIWIAAGVVAGSVLLIKWQVTAMQWAQHGCGDSAYVMALMHGEPEWYQFCLSDRRQERASGDQVPSVPERTPPVPEETGPSLEELKSEAREDLMEAERDIEASEETIKGLREQIAVSEGDITAREADIEEYERQLRGPLAEEVDADLLRGDIEIARGDIEIYQGDIDTAKADIAAEEEAIEGYRSVIVEARKVLNGEGSAVYA
jgi:hypothetical protein